MTLSGTRSSIQENVHISAPNVIENLLGEMPSLGTVKAMVGVPEEEPAWAVLVERMIMKGRTSEKETTMEWMALFTPNLLSRTRANQMRSAGSAYQVSRHNMLGQGKGHKRSITLMPARQARTLPRGLGRRANVPLE